MDRESADAIMFGVGALAAFRNIKALRYWVRPTPPRVEVVPPEPLAPELVADAEALEQLGFRRFGDQVERGYGWNRSAAFAAPACATYGNLWLGAFGAARGYLFSTFSDGAIVLTGRYAREREEGPDFVLDGVDGDWSAVLARHLDEVKRLSANREPPEAAAMPEARVHAAMRYYRHPSEIVRTRKNNAANAKLSAMGILLMAMAAGMYTKLGG